MRSTISWGTSTEAAIRSAISRGFRLSTFANPKAGVVERSPKAGSAGSSHAIPAGASEASPDWNPAFFTAANSRSARSAFRRAIMDFSCFPPSTSYNAPTDDFEFIVEALVREKDRELRRRRNRRENAIKARHRALLASRPAPRSPAEKPKPKRRTEPGAPQKKPKPKAETSTKPPVSPPPKKETDRKSVV